MRSNKFAVLLALPLVLLSALECAAQGTSGSQFLGVGIGARSMAMGGACVATTDDGTALFWNPAGLTQVTGHRVSVSHLEWLSDVTYQYAGYAVPFGDRAAVGLAIEQGSVGWDNTGEGTFDAGDFSGVLGYGRRLKPNLGVGAGLKFLSSKLGDDSASTYALDLGAVYRLSPSVRLGAAVRNVGPELSYRSDGDPLPTTLVVGGAYEWKDLTLALDVEKQNDLSACTRFGVEYSPVRYVALRGGYVSGEATALGDLTGGFGVRWDGRWALDYAYRSSEIGGTHQVALSAGFGEGVGLAAAVAGEETIPVTSLPKSNLSVMTDVIREVIEEAIDRMDIPEAAEIKITQDNQSDANWLIYSVLLEELTDRGHIVVAQGSSAGDSEHPRYEIWYKVVTCATTYPRQWREWVVGARKVERETRCEMHFRLSDENSATVWAGGVERERREIMPGTRLQELGTSGQPFVSPEIQPAGWDKVLEPVVVAGIVGGLIYLFYTSRSTN